jgi:hypothetical protein
MKAQTIVLATVTVFAIFAWWIEDRRDEAGRAKAWREASFIFIFYGIIGLLTAGASPWMD